MNDDDDDDDRIAIRIAQGIAFWSLVAISLITIFSAAVYISK